MSHNRTPARSACSQTAIAARRCICLYLCLGLILAISMADRGYASSGHVRVEFSAHHVTVGGEVTFGDPPDGDGGTGTQENQGTKDANITIDGVELEVVIGDDGIFLDGFEDDIISFSVCIPWTLALELNESASPESTLVVVSDGSDTFITFSGRFLEGMAVLRAIGFVSLDVPINSGGLETSVSGEAAIYVGQRYKVGLDERGLEFAGIRVTALPAVVE